MQPLTGGGWGRVSCCFMQYVSFLTIAFPLSKLFSTRNSRMHCLQNLQEVRLTTKLVLLSICHRLHRFQHLCVCSSLLVNQSRLANYPTCWSTGRAWSIGQFGWPANQISWPVWIFRWILTCSPTECTQICSYNVMHLLILSRCPPNLFKIFVVTIFNIHSRHCSRFLFLAVALFNILTCCSPCLPNWSKKRAIWFSTPIVISAQKSAFQAISSNPGQIQ